MPDAPEPVEVLLSSPDDVPPIIVQTNVVMDRDVMDEPQRPAVVMTRDVMQRHSQPPAGAPVRVVVRRR